MARTRSSENGVAHLEARPVHRLGELRDAAQTLSGTPGIDTKLPATVLSLRRRVWLSSLSVPIAALAILIAGRLSGLPVRIAPLVALLVVIGLVNVWTFSRLRAPGDIPPWELFAQTLIDVIALTGLLYYSGGALNPFAYLFLLPLAICAIVLPGPFLWALTAITAACYSFLLLKPLPLLPMGGPDSPVYLIGIWVAFVASVIFAAQLISGLARALREQQKILGEARERALQDERVVAVATLAAGAAHELSTPLATMAVVTSELVHDYPPERYPELNSRIEILRGQIRKCKESLSVISAAGGADRAEHARHQTVAEFVQDAVNEVRTLRPGSAIGVQLTGDGASPPVIVERTLKQALLNVLHNAVDASPREVSVRCHWDNEAVSIDVEDHGPGMNRNQRTPGGRPTHSSKESGLGLGLFLTHSALAHMGGEIRFGDAPGGGARVSVRLPLARFQKEG